MLWEGKERNFLLTYRAKKKIEKITHKALLASTREEIFKDIAEDRNFCIKKSGK